MDGESGFLLGSESFVWTERGLLKICEISQKDRVLGIGSDGEHSWSSLNFKKVKRGRVIRLTTDSSETLLSQTSEIYSIEGIKKVSMIINGVIVETANIPPQALDIFSKKTTYSSVKIGEHSIEINEKLAYLIGAQIKAKRYSDKIVFDQLEINKAHCVASICNDVRKSLGEGKIYYVAGGKRVRFDSTILARICGEIWRTHKVPTEIRESPHLVMHSFAAGILDMILQKNSAESPPTFFSTFEVDSELRRFLLNVFRLSGVIPAKMRRVFQPDGSISFRCSINTFDLTKLGLNFIRGIRIPLILQETKTISYSLVKALSSFQGEIFYMSTQEPHWSPIVDLLPLHRQILG
jgi:hypothetical protein